MRGEQWRIALPSLLFNCAAAGGTGPSSDIPIRAGILLGGEGLMRILDWGFEILGWQCPSRSGPALLQHMQQRQRIGILGIASVEIEQISI